MLPDAVVLLHDLLDEGRVVRRLYEGRQLIEREESVLEHGCLSCTVRLDVVPTVERLLKRGVGNIVIGLPPGVAAESAVEALHHGVGSPFSIDSVALACAPDALDDHIWDHHTLFESGFTAVPWDNRTPGEFLVGELSFSDTVLLTDPAPIPVNAEHRLRGAELVRELAPHATVSECNDRLRTGNHDLTKALLRSAPGAVCVPTGQEQLPSSFSTVVQTAQRPLHPERFREALASMAAGCFWLRGRLCVAAAPECCIAVRGIGPRVWLENTGPWQPGAFTGALEGHTRWPPHLGERGSVVAITAEDVDVELIRELLSHCELTDDEMAAGAHTFNDPFNIRSTR